jgi:diaminopimelate decarboxylase
MGRHSKKIEVWKSWVRHCVLTIKQLSELMGGWTPDVIDLGGGFPSFPDRDTDVYVQDGDDVDLESIAQTITTTLRDTMAEVNMPCKGLTIEVEPGRGLHCDTGIHLTTVKNIKEENQNRPRKWAELDTSEVFLAVPGVNEEPPFDYIFANKAEQANSIITDMVGMTCNAELLFMQIEAPKLVDGDLVALLNTGSYIEPMAANFNALPRPGTVLVKGEEAEMVKRHENVDDVFSRDIIPQRLK